MKLLAVSARALAGAGKSPCKRRLLTKTLLVMKLTAVLMIAAVLQVSASGNAQTVTYTAKADPLAKVFAVIKQQTGFVFFYRNADLEKGKPVSVELKDADIKSSLDATLMGQPLQYEIEGNTITISVKVNRPSVANMFAETPPVTGIIRELNGQPLSE
jgi:hypothetical protein